MPRNTYVYCPVQKKVVEKGLEIDEEEHRGPMVIGPLEPFKSPITGELITSRTQLKRHNREHGVTNSADYSPEWYARKQEQRKREMQGDTERQRQERIETLKSVMGMN